MDKHLTLLGVLYIAFGILGVLLAVFLFTAIAGGGWISQDPMAIAVTSSVGAIVAAFLLVLSIPMILAGAGLIKRRPWARMLTLVLGVLNLLNIPFGTVLGIYTIWVLMNDQTVQLFSPPVTPS
jgi:hypothetical protein